MGAADPDLSGFAELPATRGHLAAIGKRLAEHGLILRGGLHLNADEALDFHPTPKLRTLLLVGNVGASYWPHFQAWLPRQPTGLANPLDSWSKMVIDAVADEFDAKAIYPSDRPYLPFQHWAMQAEGLKPSPLGVLLHPVYGPWHAYRGALLFREQLELPEVYAGAHLCDHCHQPCRSACPVSAHAGPVFDYNGCRTYAGGRGGAVCGDACLDRNACPVGTAYRYSIEVQRFHQRAFLA